MDCFKKSSEEKVPDKNVFTALQKKEQLITMVKN